MAIEAIGALAASAAGGKGEAIRQMKLLPQGDVTSQMHSKPGMDMKFNAAMNRMDQISPMGSTMPKPVKGLFDALDQVNVQARSVSDYAATAEASGGQLTPGEIVQLTMKCQEFMFQCQLTSNIANRSSDGVQQLFRQQG